MSYIWNRKGCLHHKRKMIAQGEVIPDDIPGTTLKRHLENGDIVEGFPGPAKKAKKAPVGDVTKLEKVLEKAKLKTGKAQATHDAAKEKADKPNATPAETKKFETAQAKLTEVKETEAKALAEWAGAKEQADSDSPGKDE